MSFKSFLCAKKLSAKDAKDAKDSEVSASAEPGSDHFFKKSFLIFEARKEKVL
ncbi:MAG: hypothetical protein IID60_12355 [Proteobacteria bacterium]|nr:hypothetical protein [Pseudomonadota bacterium]